MIFPMKTIENKLPWRLKSYIYVGRDQTVISKNVDILGYQRAPLCQSNDLNKYIILGSSRLCK